jgi:NAD(P)H-dependent FMN reductase
MDAGGARAAEHLRGVLGELQVADVRATVALASFEEWTEDDRFVPHERRAGELDRVLDQVVRWGGALRTLR